ncbi:MAG: helix-turn-helix transcriptional regulator [Myxococcales bacterium]|nr:helix-turn-helix transcriptional regulator [Myxococcales bacterium]
MDDGKLVRVLKALADPQRFRMVQEIAAAGELSCGQVAARFSLSQPTISHHLRILGDAGVISVRHDAQHHFISVDRKLLDEVAATLPASLTEFGPRGRKRARKVAGRKGS